MILLDNIDEHDLEILKVMKSSLDEGWNADGIKMCGNNLESKEFVAQRLNKLFDLNMIIEVSPLRYRLHTVNAENLFWGKGELWEKILHTLYVKSIELDKLFQFTGRTDTEFNSVLDLVRNKGLVHRIDSKINENNIQLWELTPEGKKYVIEKFQIQKTNSNSIDLRELIIKTEENLRDLVHAVLTREYGALWELDPNLGWSNDQRKGLQKRLDDRKKEFPTKQNSNRLIDYCYIMNLKNLITKPGNEKLFKPIFQDWNKHLTFFNELGKHRDPIMHGTNFLSESEINLCMGICGEFDKVVEHWKKGFSRKILSYSCDMSFEVLESGNEEREKKQSLKLAQECIERIKSLSKEETITEQTEQCETYIVKLKEGIVRITTPKLTRLYNGSYAQSARMRIDSDSFDAISQTISISNHTYWHFEWTISDELNVLSLMDKIEELTGKKSGSTSISHIGGRTIAKADYGISNDQDIRIVATFSDTNSTSLSKISLTHHDHMFDQGFKKAHEIFSPDILLSIVLGEIPLAKIRELVSSSI